MSSWKEKFRRLQIDHLRSPLFFHPDPRDRDALLAYSHFHGRADELQEINNVVGKELSKHQAKKKREKKVMRHLRIDDRDRVDYYTPSTAVFHDFCSDIVDRYELGDLIIRAKVDNIDYGDLDGLTNAEGFTLSTDQGVIFSRTVVLAVGPGYKPAIPFDSNLHLKKGRGSVCHCFDGNVGEHCLPEQVLQKIDRGLHTSVVVVGGGLTSAQIADLVIRRGVTKVWLLLRRKYKLKHFDVDLEWVSKVRNQQMAVFWSADSDEERFELLKQARDGGSITPKFDKILKRHAANDRVAILTHTHITDGDWCGHSQTWSLVLSPMQENFPPHDGKYPVPAINGLPRLTDDLMWHEDVPLFLTGGLAGLRLGPGAANLAGARQGAERVAWKVEELLGEGQSSSIDSDSSGQRDMDGRRYSQRENLLSVEDRSEYTGGFVNQFQALAMDDD
ncbi:hypothetical protein PV11_02603 [Exophiala sideris]|uniref:Uncharacterized protein n=1 Tax=Exophiala sideris TaxID=1016849 RepID=A0A0D1XG24_9EURO|nr:hypothetical protein PV11_02603 [Exophiala sideris]